MPRSGHRGVSNGAAASGARGALGLVRACFGPVESRGRGGVQPRVSLWLLRPMTGGFLARPRAGDVDGLEERLGAWRASVLVSVGSVLFDAAEEVGRLLGVDGEVR